MTMASPLLSSFCCEFKYNKTCNDSNSFELLDVKPSVLKDAVLSYNILCTFSSIFGIIGAIYQVKLRLQWWQISRSYLLPEVIERQSKIILWLAVADGLASLGILCRSCVWIIVSSLDIKFNDLFCAIASGWIQYFYICTYIWTIVFAVDTFKNAADKNRCSMLMYHFVCWAVSFVICVTGLIILYSPGLQSCGDHQLQRHVPHYLSSYIPMLCAMIVNPLLFLNSSLLVRKDLSRRGSSTNEQKQIFGEVMGKFFTVVLIFYVCWLPNVVNGILLLTIGPTLKLYRTWVLGFGIALWQMMAILNPIQGFLNSLVYSSIAIWPRDQPMYIRHQPPSAITNPSVAPVENNQDQILSGDTLLVHECNETSPLLLFR